MALGVLVELANNKNGKSILVYKKPIILNQTQKHSSPYPPAEQSSAQPLLTQSSIRSHNQLPVRNVTNVALIAHLTECFTTERKIFS